MDRKLLLAGGALSVLLALPHAFLGWPAIAAQLHAQTVDPDLVEGLAVGWFFGSLAMVALGIVVVAAASEVASQAWAFRSAVAVGSAYLIFGFGALLFRSLQPQFVVFVLVGGLISGAAMHARRARSSS